MKKLLLLVAMAILIGMFVSGGYALAGSESKANVKTITLNYAAVNPMTGFEGKVFQWAFDEVEKRTEGRVKIQVFPSGTLLGFKEQLEGVQRGAADIGNISGAWFPKQVPYEAIINTPTFAPNAEWIRQTTNWVKAYWDYWDSTPALRDEMKRWKQTIWVAVPFGPYDIFSKVMLNSLEDFKGIRIRAVGLKAEYLFSPFKAIPVNIRPPEVYSAMQKGICEAAFVGIAWGDDYGIAEVSPYLIKTSGSYGGSLRTLALSALDKMTPADRETFMAIGRELSYRYAKAVDERETQLLKKYKDAGMVIKDFPADQREKWMNTCEKNVYKAFLEANKDVPNIRELFKKWLTTIGAPQLMPE